MSATIPGQETLPFGQEQRLPQLDRYQRIDVLQKVEGFLPTSQKELTESLSLQSFIGSKGGAAKHLAEIDARQHKTAMTDPNRSTRRVVREYIGYAMDARQSSNQLEALQTALIDVNPELILNRAVEHDQPGLLPFLRYFDLSVMRETGRLDTIGYDPQKVAYVPDNPGIMFYLGEGLASWRVQQVRQQLPIASRDQAERLAFWAERLGEIANHSSYQLKAIAQEGLDTIHAPQTVE